MIPALLYLGQLGLSYHNYPELLVLGLLVPPQLPLVELLQIAVEGV